MKEYPILCNDEMVRAYLGGKTQTRRPIKNQSMAGFTKSPYGLTGDKLYIREAWQHEADSCDDYKCGNPDHIYYRATDPAADTFRKWRPNIHMPKWASRIWLVIVDVQIDRIQNISEDAAWAEGVEWADKSNDWAARKYAHTDKLGPIDKFDCLWDSIYKGTEYRWDANPWVWVIETEPVK